ncbi:hypothetical protein V6N13_029554 [Hibiscus sabdariffa]
MSRCLGVCRGTPPWEVGLTLAEDTFGKFICWRSGQLSYEACINLSEALRSSAPETTISHMPAHQFFLVARKDGSCNVLQHYAALGRDKETNQLMSIRELLLGNSNFLSLVLSCLHHPCRGRRLNNFGLYVNANK